MPARQFTNAMYYTYTTCLTASPRYGREYKLAFSYVCAVILAVTLFESVVCVFLSAGDFVLQPEK